MPLTDITVHLHRGPGCTAQFMAAIDLARRHRACLKGIYVVSHPYYVPNGDLERDYLEVKNFFMNAASKAQVLAEWLHVDWNVVGVPVSDIITLNSYHTDLLIIGQPVTGGLFRRGDDQLPQRLILGTGRPVVVLPSDGNIYQFGSKILVAWKTGRESTRALHDALPLLEKATQVTVIAVASGDAQREWETAGLSALHEHLERHGIKARTAVVDCGRQSVADVLLERIGEEEADLLVVGGYTHGPRKHGDLSRSLISRMSVPVLFSH